VLIQSPADRAEEVPALVAAGAEELYAGYVPPFWVEAFGPVVSCNRRSYDEANVQSLDGVSDLVGAAARHDVPVYVALNASPVPDAMIPPMVGLAGELAGRGVRGVIVADLPLLLTLRDARFRRLDVHASTLFSAFNGAAVAFLRRAGASRVILARELSVSDTTSLAAASPATPLEVIGLRGRCPNIEGFCTHLHDDPGRTWPCELRYEKAWVGDGAHVPEGIREAIARNEGTDRHFSCGLCAIPLLERAGIHAFKIVGRGAETARKESAVAMARAMRDWGRGGVPDPAACARRGKAMYEERFGRRCRPENCYFPEFGPGAEDPAAPGGGGDP
jgi:putative protease